MHDGVLRQQEHIILSVRLTPFEFLCVQVYREMSDGEEAYLPLDSVHTYGAHFYPIHHPNCNSKGCPFQLTPTRQPFMTPIMDVCSTAAAKSLSSRRE